MIKQISFGNLEQGMDMPHLLGIQVRAFQSLLQLDPAGPDRAEVGSQGGFKDPFPITAGH